MFHNQGPFDALMTDITMPQMSGYELLALLREARPSLPVILMTGFEQKTAEAQQVLPPYVRLEKPFGETELSTALEQILATDAGAPTRTATREAV